MKLFLSISLWCSCLYSVAQNQGVGIGTTTPNTSAALDVTSTTKGMLVPRMSSEQRRLIPNAATGLLVFDNTTSSFWFRNAAGWVELIDSTKQPWQKLGANTYVNNGSNVGIGTATPTEKLEVAGTVKATELITTPASGGISVGPAITGSTRLLAGISQNADGYSYLQSIRAHGFAWGDLALNVNGGNVGIGTTTPTAKLHVAGTTRFSQGFTTDGTPQFNEGLIVDGNGANSGDGVNLLRFGSAASGEGIGSKRTGTGLQNGLDFYTGGSRRLSVSNTGDVMVGIGTPHGKLTVNGNIVALESTVKQRSYYFDVPNLIPYEGYSFTWTHNIGYKPVVMISAEYESGNTYGLVFSYKHLNDNQIQFRCSNVSGLYDSDIILRWIVVN